MNTHPRYLRPGVLALALMGATLPAGAATRVQVNGRTLMTQVPAMQMGYRVLVPMRDIFQALGSTVNYNKLTREVTARRGAAGVRLQIGKRMALVNDEQVMLDQPATIVRGRTMVPLRFVSEALGADVHWNEARRLVSISTQGMAGQPGRAVGGARTLTIPMGAVVRVALDETLSSGEARAGDIVTATVQSRVEGDSEFPPGSKIEGVVKSVQRQAGQNPGVIDLNFRAVVLPDGNRFPLSGELIGLDEDSVQGMGRSRIMARKTARGGGDRTKIIGIGAGVGYVLGRVLSKNSTVTAVLGAAGGYLYSRSRDKNRIAEAVVPRGTPFGVKLTHTLAYADTTNYGTVRNERLAAQ